MSNIRRYAVCCHVASPAPYDGPHQYRVEGDSGPYVLWEDHQAEVERLNADVERLTNERDEFKELVLQYMIDAEAERRGRHDE